MVGCLRFTSQQFLVGQSGWGDGWNEVASGELLKLGDGYVAAHYTLLSTFVRICPKEKFLEKSNV